MLKTLLDWFHQNPPEWYDDLDIAKSVGVPSPDSIADVLGQLEAAGWIQSKGQEAAEPGTRVYRLTPRPMATLTPRPDTALAAGLQLHLTADDLSHLEPEQIKELFGAIGTVARFKKPSRVEA